MSNSGGLLGPMFAASDNSTSLVDVREGFFDKKDAKVATTFDEIVNGEGISSEEVLIASKLMALVALVKEKKDYSWRVRQNKTESRWLKSYYSFRGEYSPEEQRVIAQALARNPYNSQIFIKVTKTKVLAAFGQLLDVVLSNNKIPLEIKASPSPDGVAEEAFVGPPGLEQALGEAYGYPGDGQEIAPGSTTKGLLGGLYDKYKTFVGGKSVLKGKNPDPKQFITISPAEEAARNMQKVIIDQLEQGDFQEELRKAMFECVLYGTGFIKGPFTYTQTIHNWEKDDQEKSIYAPRLDDIPKAKFVSCWNMYPDPESPTIEQCSFVIERHLLNKHELRSLKTQPGFYGPAIDRALRGQPRQERDYWENIIMDGSHSTIEEERYEALEYWGYLDKEFLEGLDTFIDKDELVNVIDMAHVNIWVCNNEVIRIVINPYVPQRIPYYAVPYETHPHQIWGVGVAENMEDTQSLMNAHIRMGIDNLKLSGSVLLEVNEAQLVPGQEMTIYDGKIFRKQGGAPGQSIYGITIPNTTQQHLMMYDKARQLADEATGMPSYAQGQSGVTSQPRTAAGTSMLMGQASLNIKTVVRNFDHYLLRPIGEAFFYWNMQFNDKKPEIKGDMQVVSNGTASLMQKEVQSQRLLSFMQLTANPLLAPFINVMYLSKQIAESLDLDPDKAVNSPEDAAMMADIMAKLSGGLEGGGQGTPSGEGSADATGGSISPPAAPAQPGQSGFSANNVQPSASQ